MSEDELKTIEARAKVGITYAEIDPHTHWPDGSAELASEDRDTLLAEVRRLRQLVSAAETRGTHAYAEDTHDNCPWCEYDTSISPKRRHAPECPAFTPDGEVR